MVANGPRIDLWGGFDVENYGDALFPRIFERELRRRVPAARIRLRSPLGQGRPLHMNRELAIEPLGEWTPSHLARMADEADVVVIGGGEIAHVRDDLLAKAYGLEGPAAAALAASRFFIDGLGPELEQHTPVAWHGIGVPFDFEGEVAERVRRALAGRAYVTVRDEDSLARLRRAGVEREVEVVPDSVLLLPRLLDDAALDARVEALRRRGAFPPHGRPLVVEGTHGLEPQAAAIAHAVQQVRRGGPPLPVALLATGPALGAHRVLDELQAHLADPVYRLPRDLDVEDIAAVIRASAGFVGSSLHGSITAVAYGLPMLMLNFDARAKLDGMSRALGTENALLHDPRDIAPGLLAQLDVTPSYRRLPQLERRLDEHFDRLASLAEASS